MMKFSMGMKGFVDAARNTNKLIEQKKQEKSGSAEGIIDISDGQSIPKEKLESIQTKNNFDGVDKSQLNFGKKSGTEEQSYENDDSEISRPMQNTNFNNNNQTDFEKEYLRRQKSEQLRVNKNIEVGSGTGFGQNNNSKHKIDSRVGNVMASAIKNTSNKTGVKTTWEECKHLKKDGTTLYCKEFHCFCKKDACPYACK
jgi:hypothetical protein